MARGQSNAHHGDRRGDRHESHFSGRVSEVVQTQADLPEPVTVQEVRGERDQNDEGEHWALDPVVAGGANRPDVEYGEGDEEHWLQTRACQ